MTTPHDPSSTDIVAAVASEQTRARIVLFLLAAGMVMALVGIWSSIRQHQLLALMGSGVQAAPGEADANDARQAGIAVIQVAVLLATVVMWCLWQYRAYANLKLVGTRDTEYTPGWSVGYWFIPIMNLFRPYQITAELHRRSELVNQRDPLGGLSRPTIVGVWWLFWIVAGFFSRMSASMSRGSTTVDDFIRATDYQIVDDVLGIVTATLAFIIVRNIDRFQRAFTSAIGAHV
jgi:hypothetical protein